MRHTVLSSAIGLPAVVRQANAPKRSISPNLAESASLSAILDKPDRGRALADRGA